MYYTAKAINVYLLHNIYFYNYPYHIHLTIVHFIIIDRRKHTTYPKYDDFGFWKWTFGVSTFNEDVWQPVEYKTKKASGDDDEEPNNDFSDQTRSITTDFLLVWINEKISVPLRIYRKQHSIKNTVTANILIMNSHLQ